MTKALASPVVDLGTAVIKTGMDYEAGMSKVQAISGATGEEMILLGQKAMEMAAKTKFSTADSAEAYQYMAMAGWKAGDMVDGLSGIMNLAAASGENLGTTSDIVTDALTAFGLTAADSGRFADVLAAASNNANTNVSMMGESFKYVAPVAGAMGYSVEDVSVALGLMANSGIKASQAGTSLRTAITNMASPTKNMAEVMEKYGITLTDADGNMLSLSEVMGQLREKMGGLDEATQASAASALFGKEAMSGMLSIINAAPADFDKLTEAINNSSGTTEEMASIMQNNAAGAFDRLNSAIDVLFTQLSSILLPIFTQVVEKITEWVNWLGTLDEGTQKLILTIAGIAAAVGPVLIVIGKIITALSTIGGAINSVISVVTGGITSIIGIGSKLMGGIQALFALIMAHPVVAVVTAIIAAVVLLWNNCEAFRDAVGAIWDAIVGFFQAAAEGIKVAFDGVVEFFSSVWEGIQSVFQGVAEFFGGIFQAAAELVQTAWNAIVEFFTLIWQGIQSVFQGVAEFFGNIFQAAAEIVQSVWSAVVEFFAGIWQGIQDVFSVVADVLGGFFSAAVEAIQGAWSAVVEFFSGVWEGIQGVFSTVAEVLGGFFQAAAEAVQAAWDAVVEFFSGVWEGIQSVFSVVAEVLGGFFAAAWEAVQSVWQAAAEFFGGIADGIHAAFEAVTQFLGEAFTAAWEIIDSIWGAAVEFFSDIWDGISSAFSSVAEFFGDIFSEAWDAVTSAWDGVTEFFSGVWEDIKGVFSDVWDTFKEIGGNILKGLWEGVSGAFGWVKEKIGGVVDGIVGLFTGKDGFDTHSPSKVFEEIGKNVMLGLGGGVSGEAGTIDANAKKIITTMKASFDGLASYFTDIGKNAMSSLANAMSSGINALQQKVSGLMNSIAAAAKAALGIHSPSKVFAGIGENMALGLAEGWDDKYSGIKRQIERGMDFGPASIGLNSGSIAYGSASSKYAPQPVNRGGDTFNFYSPKALDPVSAAREMKKAKQQMALSFVGG